MQIKVKVPGSCGELVQGTLKGVPFLITCPVDIYTEVVVSTARCPEHFGLGSKAQLALSRTIEYLGCDSFPYEIRLESEVPIGKGMASSSADIAAVCIAAAASFGETLTSAEISRLAAGIEPTDGVFFPGVVQMNYMTGRCFETYGVLPELKIAAFDCGGYIDTLEFHERTDLSELNQKNESLIAEALKVFKGNITAAGIAEAATTSALANQSIIYKANLGLIITEAKNLGALGVNIAHSGTVIGVLFNPDEDEKKITRVISILAAKYPQLRFLRRMKLISGGYEVKIAGEDF